MAQKLKIAIADYPHTMALKDGRIPIAGVDADFVTVVPQIGAFRRMVRDLEFDVCELAPTTYLIARAYGAPFVALPIFVMRRFHHGGFLVRPDANIRHPRDLEGKRVGVRAWSVTTGVWTRAILMEDYGVDCSKITWVVDDEEHVTKMRLPSNVIHAQGKSLIDMMASGDLVAAFDGNAGIGRSGSPTGGWKQAEAQTYPELFPYVASLEAAWFHRTGIYPMHGTIVVKEQAIADNPDLPRALFDAFSQAKNDWLVDLRSGEANTAVDRKYRDLAAVVGDPMPYGMAENMPTIEALMRTSLAQQLTPRALTLDEAFVDPQRP